MTRALLVAVLASLLLGCPSPGGGPPVTTILEPVPDDPGVSLRIAFRVGSQDDPVGREGLAALTARVMAEGATAHRGYAEILELLYPMAASYDVRVDVEQITFIGRAHRDTAERFAELMLDAVLDPAFAPEDVERIRTRTLDGITKTLRWANDEALGRALFHTESFAGTRYGHLSEGTVEAVSGIGAEDLRAMWRSSFTRDRVVLAVGGSYTEELVESVQARLARLPVSGPPLPPAPEPAPVSGRRVVIAAKPGQATAISFGFPIAPVRGDEDFYALAVANSWLGEHRNSSSHLYQVIREARGLNYGDYSYLEYFAEPWLRMMPDPNVPRRVQLFEVWIRPVPNETAHFALRAAVRELDRLVADGLTPEQFELTRRFLMSSSLHWADTTLSRIGWALDDRFYGVGGGGHLVRFREEMEGMTLERVNRAIREHLDPADMVIAVVTQDAEGLAQALASEAPSPISYATPKPSEVLAEDREIAAYPLGIVRDAIRVVPVDELFQR